MTAELRAQGLHKRYGAVVAVQRVDLVARPGEILGILGPNGAGKSTLFQMLAGTVVATSGSVTLDGQDITRWTLHRRARAGLGYLPQRPSILPELSVRHNLELAGDPARILATVDLVDVLDRPAGALSGGERRLVEWARLMATGPRVLLLDEPFAGVEPKRVGVLSRHIVAARDEIDRCIPSLPDRRQGRAQSIARRERHAVRNVRSVRCKAGAAVRCGVVVDGRE